MNDLTHDYLGRRLTPEQRRVQRMRRHARRTMPPRISQPREIADLSRNPYLYAWAEEMGRRFGPWTVEMRGPDFTPDANITFVAEPDRSRSRPSREELLAPYRAGHPEHADGHDCDGYAITTGEACAGRG